MMSKLPYPSGPGRIPASSTRQGLSIVPVAHGRGPPVAFQPWRETPARHGRWLTQSTMRLEKYAGYAALPVAFQA